VAGLERIACRSENPLIPSDEPDGIEKNNTSSAYIEEMNP
jgi:hypothetical protein